MQEKDCGKETVGHWRHLINWPFRSNKDPTSKSQFYSNFKSIKPMTTSRKFSLQKKNHLLKSQPPNLTEATAECCKTSITSSDKSQTCSRSLMPSTTPPLTPPPNLSSLHAPLRSNTSKSSKHSENEIAYL